ncbi:MAG: hypothetical protein JWM21_2674 [Acidobacteria bacterium]|nr:hypothetical protein [Acidobacteriota bacterium]
MSQSKFRFSLAIGILILASTAGVAQSRIQLAQGRRAIPDKVSFVVDIIRDKRSDPRNADAPDDIQIYSRFSDKVATGRVYIDGKAIGRFDESGSFNSNLLETTYGRHTITIVFASPAILLDLYLTVRGGLAREVFDEHESVGSEPPGLQKRIVELEQRVQALEAEIAGLKKKRNH